MNQTPGQPITVLKTIGSGTVMVKWNGGEADHWISTQDGDGCAVCVRFWEPVWIYMDSDCLEIKEMGI